jgi:exopolyphosphatase / guanosine-5'-triphosphate,3'-diphosphate pyrophosphatase
MIASMARYAAIDIGSNSVRMQAAEIIPGAPMRVLATDREVTRLGSSVFRQGRISEEATELVCQVLKRMSQAYTALDVVGVRAVATSAVRDASNQAEFIARATEAVGAPVEVISGPEEARLIYMGVQARWPHPKESILIIDVGGGSAEFIVGDAGELKEGISRPLGAVRLTEVFLKDDPPNPMQLVRLEKFIDEKFDPVRRRIEDFAFDRVVCTSATAAAIVSAVQSIPRSRRDEADRLRAKTSDLRKLFAEVSRLEVSERKKIEGIGPRRAEIIVAGMAVFLRALESLKLPSMFYSSAGVRDGIIADLAARGVGKERSRLTRPQLRQVESMGRKYNVELKSARQVARLADELFHGLQTLHGLPLETGKLLEAAAFLHNTGHFISGTGHHKHSAYIVASSDMPGYTDRERMMIASLCRYHRKAMPTARHDLFGGLTADEQRIVQMLIPLLRVAVGLEASRSQKVETVEVTTSAESVTIAIRGEGDIDLEMWAAERAADSFRQVYNVPVTLVKAKQ